MTLNSFFETVLGMVVIYALLSILVSLLNEMYRSVVKSRGKELYTEIQKMLKDHYNLDYAYLVYTHPMINNLARESKSERPGWIESKTFATAVIHTFADLDKTMNKSDGSNIAILDRFKGYVNSMNNSKLKDLFQNFVGTTDTYEGLENKIIVWFDSQMVALTYEYKRKQRFGLTVAAIFITLFLNIDSINLVTQLSRDPDLRKRVNEQSSGIYNTWKPIVDSLSHRYPEDEVLKKNAEKFAADYMEVMKSVDTLGLPLGYSRTDAPRVWFRPTSKKILDKLPDSNRNKPTGMNIFLYILGLAISVFSLSRGAPFWFEVLGKFVTIKNKGSKS